MVGKVVLVRFGSIIRRDDAETIRRMRQTYDEYRHRDLEIVFVTADLPHKCRRDVAKQMPWVTVDDSKRKHWTHFGVRHEAYVLADRKGKVVSMPQSEKQLERLLVQILDGQER